MPSVTTGNASSLRKLLDVLTTNLRALKSLNLPVDGWDTLLIHTIQQRFDFDTNKEWESQTFADDLPTMAEMNQFLIKRSNTWEEISSQRAKMPNMPTKSFSHASFKDKAYTCNYCSEAHSIYYCSEFLNLTPEARFKHINETNKCVNCLRDNHTVNKCKMQYSCKLCKGRHNTLLHIVINNQTLVGNEIESNQTPELLNTHHISANKQILLSTAIVSVMDTTGKYHDCRALLDVGAQSNFISEQLSAKLKLPITKVNISIRGVNDAAPTHISKSVNVPFKSKTTSFTRQIDCLIVPSVTNNMPPVSFDIGKLTIPTNLILADPSFNKSGPIDMLIGAEIFYKLLCDGQISLGNQNPDIKNTYLGWVVGGPLSVPQLSQVSCNHQTTTQVACHHQITTIHSIDDELRKLELESEKDQLNSVSQQTISEPHFLETPPIENKSSKFKGDNIELDFQKIDNLQKDSNIIKTNNLVAVEMNLSEAKNTVDDLLTGADNILNDLRTRFISNNFKDSVINNLTTTNTTWHFIQARFPNFGNLWEARTKSVKHHLNRVVGDAALIYDELYTNLTRIESCLNPPPLIPMSNNPNRLSYPTPVHFLIGDSLTAPTKEDIREVNSNRPTRWQSVQQTRRHFWKRWPSEEFGHLQIRGKWAKQNKPQLSPGLLVIPSKDNQVPLQWKPGRFLATHPGGDGLVRASSVKTTDGVVISAFARVCVCPIKTFV